MTAGWWRVFDGRAVVDRARVRVVVAVSPPMLADVLSKVLGRPDLDVVVHPERRGGRTRRFDLAVVTGDLPEGLAADIVIRLPEDTGPTGLGAVETPEGGGVVRLRGLPDLVDLLDSVLPRSVG